jgi:Fe2+ or Zn2+ uptake regulation protein
MSLTKTKALDEQITGPLEKSGFRLTPQRLHVYKTLLAKRDHPTAEEVFIRSKREMPDISMATVYNCLDALVQSRLVKLVNHERGATRYCSNMQEHHHFYCDVCSCAFDIEADSHSHRPPIRMPTGFKADRYEIAIRGLCPDCATRKK